MGAAGSTSETLPVNRSDVTAVAVVDRDDPREQERVVTLSLPRTWPA